MMLVGEDSNVFCCVGICMIVEIYVCLNDILLFCSIESYITECGRSVIDCCYSKFSSTGTFCTVVFG